MDYSRFSNKALIILALRFGERALNYINALQEARRNNHNKETQCLIYRLESKIDLIEYLIEELYYYIMLVFCN